MIRENVVGTKACLAIDMAGIKKKEDLKTKLKFQEELV
jgi:hypothetical protein